jgi:hypothetical protein
MHELEREFYASHLIGVKGKTIKYIVRNAQLAMRLKQTNAQERMVMIPELSEKNR